VPKYFTDIHYLHLFVLTGFFDPIGDHCIQKGQLTMRTNTDDFLHSIVIESFYIMAGQGLIEIILPNHIKPNSSCRKGSQNKNPAARD